MVRFSCCKSQVRPQLAQAAQVSCLGLLCKGDGPNHRWAQRELAWASHRVVVGQVRGVLVGHVLEQPRRGYEHSGHEGVPLLRPRCQVGPALRHLRTEAWRAHVITMSVITMSVITKLAVLEWRQVHQDSLSQVLRDTANTYNTFVEASRIYVRMRVAA